MPKVNFKNINTQLLNKVSTNLSNSNVKSLTGGITKGVENVETNMSGLEQFANINKALVHSKVNQENWRDVVSDISKKITPENFIGGGAEADVYKISDNYVLRLAGGETSCNNVFEPVADIFEGRSFGQPIAINSAKPQVTISKLVTGKKMYTVNMEDKDEYLMLLKKYSSLPDETLENFVSDVAFINSKGYRIDASSPENFLFDEKTKRINIVDLRKKGTSFLEATEPYGHDWVLSALVNSHDLTNLYKYMNEQERKEMFNIISALEKRIIPICKKYNIPISKWNKAEYDHMSLITILDIKDEIDYKDKNLLIPLICLKQQSWLPKLKKMFPDVDLSKYIKDYKLD